MIHSSDKLLIISLYKKIIKENQKIFEKDAVTQLKEQTGFGMYSIRKILSEYKRTGRVKSPNTTKHRLSFKEKIDEYDKNVIRRKVHEFYFNNDLPTLNKVLQAVNADENLPNFKRTTFYSLLKELNFTYINRILTEKDDLIVWRRNYLRSIKRYREEGRLIYYLDETWINAGDVTNKVSMNKTVKSKKNACLHRLTTEPVNPGGKDKGLIVLHIGSAIGFVPGGLLCFESKKHTGDYHDEINDDTFLEWFQNILPLLEDNAVIVMDNAPYHSMKKEKMPNHSWTKAEIIQWLESKGREVSENMVKAELLQIVAQNKHKFDKYVIDEIAKLNKKKVLRLPPYHCELNPIELIWSMVKRYVKSNNTTYKLQDVRLLVEQGIDQVTAEQWNKCIRHVKDEEKKMWKIDDITDTLVDISPVVSSSAVPVFIDKIDSEIFDSDF